MLQGPSRRKHIEDFENDQEQYQLNRNSKNLENLFQSCKRMKKLEKSEVDRLIYATNSECYEEDENGTKYFHAKLKTASSASNVFKLRLENGITTELINFGMYKSDDMVCFRCQRPITRELHELLSRLPKLSDEDSQKMDAEITLEEAEMVLKTLKKNKAPGIDGLPYEFLLFFWDLIGSFWLEMIKEALELGLLPTTSRSALLKFLAKPGRDWELLGSYRPLALGCSDTKLYSAIIGSRFYDVTHKLVGETQNAFCKFRLRDDNNLLVAARLEELQDLEKSGALAIDYLKAFDSVQRDFTNLVLEYFGFGENLIKMVNLIYKDALVNVFNLGKVWEDTVHPKDIIKLSTHLFCLQLEQGCQSS